MYLKRNKIHKYCTDSLQNVSDLFCACQPNLFIFCPLFSNLSGGWCVFQVLVLQRARHPGCVQEAVGASARHPQGGAEKYDQGCRLPAQEGPPGQSGIGESRPASGGPNTTPLGNLTHPSRQPPLGTSMWSQIALGFYNQSAFRYSTAGPGRNRCRSGLKAPEGRKENTRLKGICSRSSRDLKDYKIVFFF